MSRCENIGCHEIDCRHHARFRLRHRDGCTLLWCSACIMRFVDDADEIESLALCDDRTGLSLYTQDRTFREALANVLLLRDPVISRDDP